MGAAVSVDFHLRPHAAPFFFLPPQSEGFLNPLNAYHGHVVARWELRQQANKQKQAWRIFRPPRYQSDCVAQACFGVQGEKVYHCGNYAIVFCYYCLKRLINVSLLTGWPFAKVRPELVLSWPVFFSSCWYHPPTTSSSSLFQNSWVIWQYCFFFVAFLNFLFVF